MDEYIERELAIEALSRGEGCGNVCRRAIERILAADVAPVRHGRWIFGKDLPCNWGNHPKNKHHLYCSECLEQAFNRSEDNDPDFDVDTLYCPNCGAKMDLEG